MNMRARIRDGDQRAFEELFDQYAKAVYNHAYRMTGDWSVADDVVSLTFLEAWRLRQRLSPDGGSLRPWLLVVATNVARNLRRARRRHEEVVVRIPRNDVVPDFTEELVEQIADKERLAEVRTAIGRLRKHEQDVLLLCVGAGLDYAETAEALGIPIGTVRSRLSRARKKLELAMTRRQINGDRDEAVRSMQGSTR
ncbi:RNA polymerase subunit sigma-70 [Nonomuraea sp. WAC 01424]|nr:RNA polymerase subunit sigma-70 [Nonomuraea sp. WAC 01424]